ncbi:MAG TPA: MBL fold metallo-hydrolase [Xanthobacteraceae bacterium]|jgi:ribonuclease BN (tRNA processing enzyme)|nr:MBL fold metallo-hydrolase [Xanthobacteraceae bacterium]
MKKAALLAAAVLFALAGQAAAETTLITLGTAGGPVPQAKRAQSSNLLVVNGALYLIDAGGGVTGRIVQSGNSFRAASKIFITHAHSDHTAGLATLLVSEWEQQAPPIDVYGSGVEALVKGAIDYLMPNADIRWSEGKKRPMTETFRGHDVQPGVVYQDANVKVTAVENTHFHFQPNDPAYGKYKSYSYRFETPDRVVFFTGDTGPSDAVVDLAKGADLYVTETTSPEDVVELFKKNGTWQSKSDAEKEGFLRHMHEEHVTPEDIGKMAAKAGVKAVVMSHIGPSVKPDDDYQRYVDEAKKYYSGPITLAKDLMRF